MGGRAVLAASLAMVLGQALPAAAQVSGGGTVTLSPEAAPSNDVTSSQRPRPRPDAAPAQEPTPTAADPASAPQTATKAAPPPPRDPSKGAVTNLPIPRFVSLKGNEGNARRGPSLTHRIDWVFTTSGMPLRVTAEHENWRRVEDADGMGGWVHYALLSGVRSVLVSVDMAEFRVQPTRAAGVAFQAERGVVGRLLECDPDWCRVNVQGEKGWIEKAALWGVLAGEVVE